MIDPEDTSAAEMTEFTNTCDDDRSSAAVFTDEDGSSYENYVTQTS